MLYMLFMLMFVKLLVYCLLGTLVELAVSLNSILFRLLILYSVFEDWFGAVDVIAQQLAFAARPPTLTRYSYGCPGAESNYTEGWSYAA